MTSSANGNHISCTRFASSETNNEINSKTLNLYSAEKQRDKTKRTEKKRITNNTYTINDERSYTRHFNQQLNMFNFG